MDPHAQPFRAQNVKTAFQFIHIGNIYDKIDTCMAYSRGFLYQSNTHTIRMCHIWYFRHYLNIKIYININVNCVLRRHPPPK